MSTSACNCLFLSPRGGIFPHLKKKVGGGVKKMTSRKNSKSLSVVLFVLGGGGGEGGRLFPHVQMTGGFVIMVTNLGMRGCGFEFWFRQQSCHILISLRVESYSSLPGSSLSIFAVTGYTAGF